MRNLESLKFHISGVYDFLVSNDRDFPSLRIGVGIYRNLGSLEDGFRNLLKLTTKIEDVRRTITNIRAEGDGSTTNLEALYNVATSNGIGWRKNSVKFLYMFGNSPGHEPTCVDGKNITRREVGSQLNERSITLFTINFDGGMNRFTHAKSAACGATNGGSRQSKTISEATGGFDFQTSATFLPSSLFRLRYGTWSAAAEVVVDARDCRGRVRIDYPVLEPPFKFRYAETARQSFDDIFDMENRVQTFHIANGCVSGPFRCQVNYDVKTARGVVHKGRTLNLFGCV